MTDSGNEPATPEGVSFLPGGTVALLRQWGIREWGHRWRHLLPEGVNVSLEMEVIDGVPHCTEVRFVSTRSDRGVPAKAIRDFRLEDWIERACAATASRRDGDGWTVASEAESRTATRAARARTRGGYPDEMLQEVADVYNHNVALHPTKAVREAFGVAHSTAQLYVKKARDGGFLAPVGNSQPGERS